MKVTKDMLVKELEGFPIKVVEKMLEKQVEQGYKEDVTVFQNNKDVGYVNKGFNWAETIEGYIFWHDVINLKNFNLFFEKYPRLSKEVYIKNNPGLGIKIIEELERRGGINHHNYKGNCSYTNSIYYIHPLNNSINICNDYDDLGYFILKYFEEIIIEEPILELTLEEIAKKYGVNNIKIVNNK